MDLSLVEGIHTLGRGRCFWSSIGAVVGLAILFGMFVDPFQIENTSYFLIWVFMALGLCLMWGYGGILSFGQTAFFGLAGYAYSIITLNFGDASSVTWAALIAAIALSGLCAAFLGYFMFYGGVTDVFVAIVTLAVTLVLETFLAQTAGPEWAIGTARLNGFNGMTGMPPLGIPWFDGDVLVEGRILFFLLLSAIVITYIGLRMLVNSHFGRVLVAIRENPLRATMLGFDIRAYQLGAFVIGSALAGVSGVMYVAWGQYITPSSMGLYSAVLPVIWVAVGGRKDLTAALIGTLVILYVSQALAIYGSQYALILLGVILLMVILFVPDGFIVGIALGYRKWFRRKHRILSKPEI
ncbi:MAG: ABC transporter permease [Candidimonas sp.]|nr:MAG: ABC transporter permease [Candidimonas sp.]